MKQIKKLINCFSFKGRATRKEFATIYLVHFLSKLLVWLFLILLIIWWKSNDQYTFIPDKDLFGNVLVYAYIIIVISFFILSFVKIATTKRRLHDLNLSKRKELYTEFNKELNRETYLLLFEPGTTGDNMYGKDPLR